MNQWHLVTKRPAAFLSLGIPCCSDLSNIDQYAGVLVDKQLVQQHDPLLNNLPAAACFFIEPAKLDAGYDLISEIVVPQSMLDGLFGTRSDEAARRVRVFHKSFARPQSQEGIDRAADSGFTSNE